MNTERKLLLSYLFLYPIYYVIAMAVATLILAFIFGWTVDFGMKIFYIFAGIMALVSYIAHWDIGAYAIKRFCKGSS